MSLYSHSRLNSYRNCPRKFLWRYVWDVDPGVEGVEAFTGKRVHESLEILYRGVIRGEELPSLPAILDRFHSDWDRSWNDGIRIVADHDASYYRRRGVSCLVGYYERHHPFRSGTTVDVERAFEFRLEGGRPYRIRGFLDRLDVAGDGALEIHDYKTGKRTPSRRTLAGDLQVGLYEMAARALHPEHRRVRLVWHYLASGTEHRLPERGPAALAALRRETARRIEAIEGRIRAYMASLEPAAARSLSRCRGRKLSSLPGGARDDSHLFPARVGPLCRWCGYLAWCPEGSRHARVPFHPPPSPPEPPPPAAARIVDARQLELF